MLRKIIVAAVAAALLALLTPSDACAWGAAHVGYTHVGPYGVQHYGRTAAVGPYGAYSGGHYGAYGYGGASYYAGYGEAARYGVGSGAYRYNADYGPGGLYNYGTFPSYGGAYAGGVYRRY